MATTEQILEVRNNTNVTITEYSDEDIGDLIDISSVNCASATIFKWLLAKVGKDGKLKQSSTGIESHTFASLKELMDYYKEMYKFYKDLCDNDDGYTSMFAKSKRDSVAGVITQDEINELNNN